ncbi:MAG: DNA recombination protein RmuC [Bacteroidetes bacterium]|nr:DNA recombination protein RmuC [Bacteroidota bacterium]MDA0904272.1 DNA recombination protein RmuC [Bacteroidota bacterium]MDA1241866.1 DNA recombination protein RmuC [Bacteroidota bacterium]
MILTALASLSALFGFLACVMLMRMKEKQDGPGLRSGEELDLRMVLSDQEGRVRDEFSRNRKEASDQAQAQREELRNNLSSFEKHLDEDAKELQGLLRQQFGDLLLQLDQQGKTAVDAVKDVRETVDKQLKEIREDNGNRLEEMRKTVDEKLQSTLEKRLGDSFKLVSDRLEQVHKGLGEMQSLASGVGDLKKVLSNVKTKGILGEYQLGNILEQMLAREQFEENIATRPGSSERVEFAVRMPGQGDNESVWLPIDSKFPLKGYEDLINARELGDLASIQAAEKALARTIESFAKDISEKYLEAPYTTEFGVMFLPVESLYAEVLRHPGVFETLQRKYRITVTGPTTMSALLNSLQMGFRTLAVTKRSSEVWKILEAVKTEFGKFSEQLERVDDRLGKAKSELEKLRNTRTNQMERKLRDVATLEARESAQLLDLPDATPSHGLESDE